MFTRRNFAIRLRGRNRTLIFLLICTNIITYFNFSGDVPRLWSNPCRTDMKNCTSHPSEPSHILVHNITRGHGFQGFVFFSSYRLSSSTFIAIGLTALALHHSISGEGCRWIRPDGTIIQGTLRVDYPGDAHKKDYEVALLICTLTEDLPIAVGGQLFMTIDMEELKVYLEKPDKRRSKYKPNNPHPPFKSNITFCSSPMFGRFDSFRMRQFLDFHRLMHGFDLFHMYDDGGIDKELINVLRPYVKKGMMTITDVTEVTNNFQTWYAQVLVVNDCAYRSHFTSRWAVFLDFDEFLFVPKPPHSIHAILQQHADQPWLSFGSEYWHTRECTHSANVSEGQPQPWDLERLVFKQSEIHCVNPGRYASRNVCAGYDGHRKYIINPRKVQLCGIHNVVKPLREGIHLDTDIIHLKHFRAWNTKSLPTCQQYIHDTDWIPASWKRDFSFAKIVKMVREKAS